VSKDITSRETESRVRKAVLAGAAIGAALAIGFSALGAASPEPRDHPLGAAGGPIELVLLPFCLPGLLLHRCLVSPLFWYLLPYDRCGCFAAGLERFVAYPALQAVLYGAAVWLCFGILQCWRRNKDKARHR
jgi:hypothetical protein